MTRQLLINKLGLIQNSRVVSFFLLAVTAFYCTFPLFVHKFLPVGQDMISHIFLADQFTRSINDGVFFPRWVPDANNGYGSPIFIFYSPLSYYFVSGIYNFLHSIIISMSMAVWFSFFFSGITMFIASSALFGRSGSLLSGIIYQILPFHIIDLYMRGTFAELFAFVWFPLIVFYIHNIFESEKKMAFFGLAVSYAGLILTHLASAFIFTVPIVGYFLYRFSFKNKEPLLKMLFSLILGLGLSSFYLIPVIFEQKFVHIDYLVSCPICDYKKNFLFMWEDVREILDSFSIHLHVGVVLEVMLFLVIVSMIRNNRQQLQYRRHQNFFIFLFLLAFFLVTPLSRPIWDFIPAFAILQFPWRWIVVMELSLCLLICATFSENEILSPKSDAFKKKASDYLLITLVLISLITISGNPVLTENAKGEILNRGQVWNSIYLFREYTPVWANYAKGIKSEKENERVSVISGSALTRTADWKSEKRIITVNASTPSLLKISTLYYPGWNADIDGRQVRIATEKGSGAMLIEVSEGVHTLGLRFLDTPLRYYSKLISLVSCIFLIFLAWLMTRQSRDGSPKTESAHTAL